MAVSKSQIEELYDFIHPLAVRAGEILLEGYQNAGKKVDLKDGEFFNVVTSYDNQIEEFLMEKILASYPDHKFIGEEDTHKNNNVTKELTDAPTWIIDPIDGTSNFIKQIPHVSVSIGLSIQKQIVLGVVNNPTQNKLYTAKLGQGAFCNGKPIQVSSCEHINDANVAYEVCLLHAPKIRNKHIKRIYHVGSNARRWVNMYKTVAPFHIFRKSFPDSWPIQLWWIPFAWWLLEIWMPFTSRTCIHGIVQLVTCSSVRPVEWSLIHMADPSIS